MLFVASEVGDTLGIVNVRASILEFDGSERHVHAVYTDSGPHETTSSTAKGLHKLIFR